MTKHETIILRDDDVLENNTYGNIEFDVLIKVVGDNVVIDNIMVYSPKKDFSRVIQVSGKNCIIKNSRFQDFSVMGCVIVVEHDEEPNNCIIQDCLFYGGLDMKKNGCEAIRLGESKTSQKGEGRNIIYRNRMENWDREIEIISVKNDNNLIVNNEIVNCAGSICLRHSRNSMVAYNLIDGKAKKKSAGIRVCGDNNTVIGNVLLNIHGDGLRCAISLMCSNPLNRYGKIKKCYLIYNSLFNCKNGIAFGMKKQEANIKPEEVYLQGTTFDKCKYANTKHKDHLGTDKIIQGGSNQEDKDGSKKLTYPTKPEEFELSTLDDMKKDIVNYTNKKIKEMDDKKPLTPIPEEKEDFIIKDDDDDVDTPKRMVDVDVFMNKLIKKITMLSKVKQFENIQKKMDENLKEHRKLFDELKEIMK